MLNRDVNYLPDRSRPLQRKIAEHRDRDLGNRNQYSTYDKMNDEGFFDLSESGLRSWTGYRWDYSWEYWSMRVVVGIVMSVAFFLIRGCSGGGT